MLMDRAGEPRVIICTELFSKIETRGAAAENVGDGGSEFEPATPRDRRIWEDVVSVEDVQV